MPNFTNGFVERALNANVASGPGPIVRRNDNGDGFEVRLTIGKGFSLTTTIMDADHNGELTQEDITLGGATNSVFALTEIHDSSVTVADQQRLNRERIDVEVSSDESATVTYSQDKWGFREATEAERNAARRSPGGISLSGTPVVIENNPEQGRFTLSQEDSTELRDHAIEQLTQALPAVPE